jgi:hypothetical protein
VRALEHEHNAQLLRIDGQQVRLLDGNKLLGAYDAKVQLVFRLQGCQPGQQHFKCCQMQAASRQCDAVGEDNCLLCPMCCDQARLDAVQVKLASHQHAVVFRWLARAVNELCFIEHAIKCYGIWHGLVDAYFPRVQMAMQFDGKQHEEGQRMFYREQGQQLQKDLQFNERMWSAGVRVMRMHHTDGGENGKHTVLRALAWCRQHPGCNLLLVSYRYQAMHVKGQEGPVPYCEYMASKLGAEWKHGIIHRQPAAAAFGLGRAQVTPLVQGMHGILDELMAVLRPACHLL